MTDGFIEVMIQFANSGVKDSIVFEKFLLKDALTLSGLFSLFSGKFPGSYFESYEYFSHFTEEFIIYDKALEAIHCGKLPASADLHIERRYWIKVSDLGKWLLWLYHSDIQPSQHMNRFLEKYLIGKPTGIPSNIARNLIESDLEVLEIMKQYRDTRDVELLDQRTMRMISNKIESNRNCQPFARVYLEKGKGNVPKNRKDNLVKLVKKKLIALTISSEFDELCSAKIKD